MHIEISGNTENEERDILYQVKESEASDL